MIQMGRPAPMLMFWHSLLPKRGCLGLRETASEQHILMAKMGLIFIKLYRIILWFAGVPGFELAQNHVMVRFYCYIYFVEVVYYI